MGIPDAIGNFLWDEIKKGIWAQWLKLLFLLVFSGVVTYLFIDGSYLLRGSSELVARGQGYVWAAGALVLCFITNGAKLMKGMTAIVPDQEVVAALETEFQKVQPDQEKK